jgi:sulfide dehydrogenase cytochrome subunit
LRVAAASPSRKGSHPTNQQSTLEKTMLRKTLFTVCVLAALPAAADTTAALARSCNNCHGVNGVSAGGPMPSIGGLPESYLKNVLLQWKHGERYAATMDRHVKGYSDDELAALATYFSKQKWTPVAQKTDPALVKRGKEVSERCESCHGETGKSDDADTPNLNGQWAQYLELELTKYREDAVKMPHKKMRANAKKLDAADVKAVAEYYASQK